MRPGETVKIVVTGSIATDHLMRFPGRFADVLLPDQLDKVSLSFLVDDLVIRHGGVGPNIAVGMARLGLRPTLVGAVGEDFAEYRHALERDGVDCDSVFVTPTSHTARFVCTTDTDQCQIASFYIGAMAHADEIDLEPVIRRLGGADLVLIGANDPAAMVRYTRECRERGLRFVADPSQQITRMPGEDLRALIDGAAYLMTNEYESQLLRTKTGLSDAEILGQVGVWVTTLGADGVRIVANGHDEVRVPVARVKEIVDPTGVGDAFRAGFFSALSWKLPVEQSAQVGSLLAALVLESLGTQEYVVQTEEFVQRLADSYGDLTARAVLPHLPSA